MENENGQVSPITIQDIAATVRIMDLATSRGAWQGNELSSIGAVRDKLAAFVQAETERVAAIQANGEEDAAPPKEQGKANGKK